MPVSTTDLTARIREQLDVNAAWRRGELASAGSLDLGTVQEQMDGYEDAIRRALRKCETLNRSGLPDPMIIAAGLADDLAIALGVPTESEPCAQHQGGA